MSQPAQVRADISDTGAEVDHDARMAAGLAVDEHHPADAGRRRGQLARGHPGRAQDDARRPSRQLSKKTDLLGGVFTRVGDEHPLPDSLRRAADALEHLSEIRVGQVGHDDPYRGDRSAQTLGARVGTKVQFAGGAQYALRHGVFGRPRAAEYPRDCGERDACGRSNLANSARTSAIGRLMTHCVIRPRPGPRPRPSVGRLILRPRRQPGVDPPKAHSECPLAGR